MAAKAQRRWKYICHIKLNQSSRIMEISGERTATDTDIISSMEHLAKEYDGIIVRTTITDVTAAAATETSPSTALIPINTAKKEEKETEVPDQFYLTTPYTPVVPKTFPIVTKES